MTAASARLFPPLAFKSSVDATTRAWFTTFTDLVLLLLTFFVLVFAMSKVDTARYQAMARSYMGAVNPVLGESAEPARVSVVLPAASAFQGDDLAYLATVLQTAFAGNPSLSGIQFRLTAQYLILALPASDMFAPGAAAVSGDAGRYLFALGGVLSNLKNRIAVIGFNDAIVGPENEASVNHGNDGSWEIALARAGAVSQGLASAGYTGPVTVLGRGERLGEVQIMILPEAAES